MALPQLPGPPGLPSDTPVQPCGTNDRRGFWNILPPGAIYQPLIHWINRPTFQQVVEIQKQAPR